MFSNLIPLEFFSPKQTFNRHSKERYISRIRGLNWLDLVFSLHQKIRKELPSSQRHFLLPRTKDYFEALLKEEKGVLFGVFHKNSLVGLMSVLFAESFTEALKEKYLSCPQAEIFVEENFKSCPVAVIQSLGLSQEHKGISLAKQLLFSGKLFAEQKGCSYVFAQIAEENIPSIFCFREAGFDVVAAWNSDYRRLLLRWVCHSNIGLRLPNSMVA